MFWLGLGFGLVLHIPATVLSELWRSLQKEPAMKRFRSAITGRFVAAWYAMLNKLTTIAETIRRK